MVGSWMMSVDSPVTKFVFHTPPSIVSAIRTKSSVLRMWVIPFGPPAEVRLATFLMTGGMEIVPLGRTR